MELKISNLSKKFGNKLVLNNINLTFTNGIYAILGPNGAGKSTFINIVMGLLPFTSGHIEMNGTDIRKNETEFLNSVGYMPQNMKFYKNFSGKDMLEYIGVLKGLSKEESRKKAELLLKKVNLYNEKNKKIGKYSGGMKQRLGIAQTLITDPKILIFDEPTAGLDPRERIRFRNIVTNLSNDKIVIICTHIVSDIDTISDTIVMMKNGKIGIVDSPENVCNDLNGSMWNIVVKYDELESVSELNVHSVSKMNDKYVLRVYSETKPNPDAVLTCATLEDAYLHYFTEESNAFSL